MTDIKEDIHSSSAELPRDILLRQVMLNLLFHEIFILILFPYRSGGWKKVCLDGSYIAKCQMPNTSFSVLMFEENLWRYKVDLTLAEKSEYHLSYKEWKAARKATTTK